MGKQKTNKEWMYWFDKYEKGEMDWKEYSKSRKYARDWFRIKYRNYIRHGDYIINSMTGKKATGRPKKEKEISWDDFTREELIEIAKKYKESNKHKKKSDKDKEASTFSMPKSKIAWILGISRSGMYYTKKNNNKRNPKIEQIILTTFNEYKGIFGRDRIAAITGINYKRVGRYMKAMGLECKIRKAKRKSEVKNTNAKYKDLVNRRYNMKNVIATDVSYIKVNGSFKYLSVAIDHHSKKFYRETSVDSMTTP